uniref:Uncharacterized protein n=1 Tax=Acrobeloides nanus TaxID=290746 RepID=A0A914DKU1_9BILA
METSFIANILAFTFGVNAIKNLFVLDRNGLVLNRSACYQMCVFIFGAIFTFVHYTLEPPTNYGWDANINISGTGFSGILLAVSIWYYLSQVKDK